MLPDIYALHYNKKRQMASFGERKLIDTIITRININNYILFILFLRTDCFVSSGILVLNSLNRTAAYMRQ